MKTVFDDSWDIDEIGEAGNFLKSSGVRGNSGVSGSPDMTQILFTRSNGHTVTIQGFLSEDGNVHSWWPKY